jgi:hypothetical protein
MRIDGAIQRRSSKEETVKFTVPIGGQEAEKK